MQNVHGMTKAANGELSGGQNMPFGAIERTIARRYLGAKKSEGGVASIAWISFFCIMLAITAMITIMSIMNGFRAKLLELTIGSQGHIYVLSAEANPAPETLQALSQRLSAVPGVEEAFEFSENPVGLQANGQLTFGQVTGISKADLESFELIANSVVQGSFENFGQGRGSEHQIAMGSFLAAGLGLTVGDKVTLLTSRLQTSAIGPPRPIYKTYTIGAIFQTQLYLTDQTTIFMDYEQSLLLFSKGDRPGSIQMRLNDPDQTEKLISDVREAANMPIIVRTWKDQNATTATALRTEQIAMRFIFIVVVIISTFPILAAMIMLVKNKARDIAILRTIGATQGAVLRIFFIAGATVGVLGTVAGVALGVLICENISAIEAVIEMVTGQPLFPPDVYQLAGGIPAKLVWSEVIGIAFCGFLISAFATFFPALAASRTDPVEALRYE